MRASIFLEDTLTVAHPGNQQPATRNQPITNSNMQPATCNTCSSSNSNLKLMSLENLLNTRQTKPFT